MLCNRPKWMPDGAQASTPENCREQQLGASKTRELYGQPNSSSSLPPSAIANSPSRTSSSHVLATSPPLRPGRRSPARPRPPRRPRPLVRCRRGSHRGQGPRGRLRRRRHLCHRSGNRSLPPRVVPTSDTWPAEAFLVPGRPQLASRMPSSGPRVGPMDVRVAVANIFASI